jgi:hypothetical protein
VNARIEVTAAVRFAARLNRAWTSLESRRDHLFAEMATAEATGDVQRAAVAALHVVNLMRRALQLTAVQKRRAF